MASTTAPPLTREAKKSRTRQALLDAAAKLVARDGAQATSLDRIAEEAGLTKGAVYSNFAGKEDLLFALGESAAGPTVNLDAEWERASSFAEAMEASGRAIARELGTVPARSFRLGLELFYFALRNSRARKRLAATRRDDTEATAAVLERGAGKGGGAPPPPPPPAPP